jgi:hypothetical protein
MGAPVIHSECPPLDTRVGAIHWNADDITHYAGVFGERFAYRIVKVAPLDIADR